MAASTTQDRSISKQAERVISENAGRLLAFDGPVRRDDLGEARELIREMQEAING